MPNPDTIPTADSRRLPDAHCSPPKRRKGETAEKYRDRLANWKIEEAFKRRAQSKMHGVGHDRNKAWRIAQAERDQTLTEGENW